MVRKRDDHGGRKGTDRGTGYGNTRSVHDHESYHWTPQNSWNLGPSHSKGQVIRCVTPGQNNYSDFRIVPWAPTVRTLQDMPSGRILIVDDNASLRRCIRTFLESATPLEICGEAVDGVDAIQKAQQLNPDLILLDLAMPKMNGAEAASVLEAQNAPHSNHRLHAVWRIRG